MLQNIAKDAGSTAVDELTKSTLPEAEQIGKNLIDHLMEQLACLGDKVKSNIQGSSLPVDLNITCDIHIYGKIGDLQIGKEVKVGK